MTKWFYLILGGSVGTVTRYLFSGFIYEIAGTRFPYGTLAVNLLGCFLAGFLVAIAEEKFLFSPDIRVLLFVGFLGAFTTFSTFILETANLIRDGQTFVALGNVLGSVLLGFLVFRLGIIFGEII